MSEPEFPYGLDKELSFVSSTSEESYDDIPITPADEVRAKDLHFKTFNYFESEQVYFPSKYNTKAKKKPRRKQTMERKLEAALDSWMEEKSSNLKEAQKGLEPF